MSYYAEVKILLPVDPSGAVSITPDPRGFVLTDEDTGNRIATSTSAKALGRWAFERGAGAVKYDFDLNQDGELT